MSTDIRSAILAVIADVVPEADVSTLDASVDLRDELDIDSMDFLNVIIGIHERLGVEIPEADYDRVRSLDALVAYVSERATAATVSV